MTNIINNEPFLSDNKLYQLAITEKQSHEARRDEINKYYITLFSSIIAIIPFINNFTKDSSFQYQLYATRTSLIILSIIGVILTITWILSLKRILVHLEILDKIIMELESRHNKLFITIILQELVKKHSPVRITKYQMIIPYVFISAFLAVILYCMYPFLIVLII